MEREEEEINENMEEERTRARKETNQKVNTETASTKKIKKNR